MPVPAVGVFPPFLGPDIGATAAYLDAAAAAGLDHVCAGDHVTFFGGIGFDGMIRAAVLAALEPRLAVHLAVYLLPLRHPVPVARQVADLAHLAPGRLVLGVGVGGEDRHEIESCGVDPATRGRRMDDSLAVLRGLLAGEAVTHRGEFFDLDDVLIRPSPPAAVPLVVGGRSDAAVRRAGRLGDGWLAIWVSPRRFAEAVERVADEAGAAGRPDVPDRHALQVWCGFGESPGAARPPLATAMQTLYGIPFERFERYSPAGTAEDVAAFLAPYVDAGCRTFHLVPQAADPEAALAGAAEVKRLLS